MWGTTVEIVENFDEPKRILMKSWLAEHSYKLNHDNEIYFFDVPFNEAIETIKDFSNFFNVEVFVSGTIKPNQTKQSNPVI